MGFSESVSTVNSLIRTVLGLVVVGGLGTAGYVGYSAYSAGERKEKELATTKEELATARSRLTEQAEELAAKAKQISTMDAEIKRQKIEIDRLDTAMRLLKVDHRVARLNVLDQFPNPNGDNLLTKIQFVELDSQDNEIDSKTVVIEGDVVYIDSFVVKFDDKYVEQADLHRSTSLVLFRRIFGEMQNPKDGFALDSKDQLRPKAYAGDREMSEFERKIWTDFWSIANDPKKAKKIGIRAAHGNAPSMKVEKGKRYKVLLRSSDGLSIIPDGLVAPKQPTT